jgi:hypothetical protein
MLRSHALPALLAGLFACAPARVAAPPAPAATDPAPAPRPPPPAAPRAVELTFLRAEPGQRERLVRFLDANWLAMDRLAVARGLFLEARLLEARDEGAADPAWDVVVVVTYRDTGGYESVRAPFEEIRRAHAKVLIDGLDLAALGRVVASRSLVESTPPAR